MVRVGPVLKLQIRGSGGRRDPSRFDRVGNNWAKPSRRGSGRHVDRQYKISGSRICQPQLRRKKKHHSHRPEINLQPTTRPLPPKQHFMVMVVAVLSPSGAPNDRRFPMACRVGHSPLCGTSRRRRTRPSKNTTQILPGDSSDFARRQIRWRQQSDRWTEIEPQFAVHSRSDAPCRGFSSAGGTQAHGEKSVEMGNRRGGFRENSFNYVCARRPRNAFADDFFPVVEKSCSAKKPFPHHPQNAERRVTEDGAGTICSAAWRRGARKSPVCPTSVRLENGRFGECMRFANYLYGEFFTSIRLRFPIEDRWICTYLFGLHSVKGFGLVARTNPGAPAKSRDRSVGTDVRVHSPPAYIQLMHPLRDLRTRRANDRRGGASIRTLAVKQILVIGRALDTPIVSGIDTCRRGEYGKYVTAIVELKARFDEKLVTSNARENEQSGVQSFYGTVD